MFDAPWSMPLKLLTFGATALLLTIAAIGLLNPIPDGNTIWLLAMVGIPLTIMVVAPFFMIRGYELNGNQLFVHRLGWKSALDLTGLRSVEVDPEAMKRSLRLFGNGGLFCYAGLYRNKKLGSYRAFATAPSLAVVLRLAEKIVVVTPDEPQRFAAAVERLG